MNALIEGLGFPRPDRDLQRARFSAATGQTCAVCGQTLTGTVYRRTVRWNGGLGDRVTALVCSDCRCDLDGSKYARLCEKCRPYRSVWVWDPGFEDSYQLQQWQCPEAGDGHRGDYCNDCHPRRWREAQCRGCGRTLMVRPRRGLRFETDEWGQEAWDAKALVFCSHRCRDLHGRMQVADRCHEARANRPCATCAQPFTPPRSDGLYCSPACRQRAHRARRKDTTAVGAP
jgi:hypothetical protein